MGAACHRLCIALAALMPLFLPAAASAQAETPIARDRPVSDYSSLPESEATEVLVVGTAHLAGIEGVTPEMIAPLVDLLAEWAPRAIGVERMPGNEVEALLADPRYAEAVRTFVGDEQILATRDAQALTGLSTYGALAAMEEWTDVPGAPAVLRERLLTAMAAFDPETALLYWRRLDRADTDLPQSIRDRLVPLDESLNERVSVAVALAQRLELPRIWGVDSQLDKDRFQALQPALGEAIGSLSEEDMAWLNQVATDQTAAIEKGDLLSLYAAMNGAAYREADLVGQFDLFNRLPVQQRSGRVRQALWDERNLRIAANVRRMTARHPGERVMVLIGAGHKPFLDELIAVALDVRSVQIDYDAR